MTKLVPFGWNLSFDRLKRTRPFDLRSLSSRCIDGLSKGEERHEEHQGHCDSVHDQVVCSSETKRNFVKDRAFEPNL